MKIQYNRNRYYDYYTGRFTTQDPMGYVHGMSLYSYASDSPINRLVVGPSGIVGDIGIGIGIRIGERIRDWLLCRAAERAVAALVRGHVDEGWRNYTGLSPRKEVVELSDSDMQEVMKQYNVMNEIINSLVEECKNSLPEGWENRKTERGLDYSSFGYGQSWYYYDGSWGAALAGVNFTAITTCTCKKLSWKISIHDEFKFTPHWRGWKRLPRNIIVTLVDVYNGRLDCGWRPFYYDGEKSGKVPIPCSAR